MLFRSAESTVRVLGPLRTLMRDRATLVISHSLLTVHDATTILVLEAGSIVERGSHAELMALDGRYAELYRLQQRVPRVDRPTGAADRASDNGRACARASRRVERRVVPPGLAALGCEGIQRRVFPDEVPEA